jgi:hypothetical protein
LTILNTDCRDTKKLLKTKFVDFEKTDSGILKVIFKVNFNQKITLMDAQAYVTAVVQMAEGKKQPSLLNFLNFSNLPSVKIVDFLGKNKDLQNVSGPKAVVLNSYIVRMIFTQYMKIAGNHLPYKIFKTEAEAMSWLKTQL